MIKTGIDLVEVERIRALGKKRGDRFLQRVFSPEEIEYCFRNRDPWPHLAARFAAKEALVKTLGKEFTFREISVEHDGSGRPFFRFYGKMSELVKGQGVKSLDVSLTHTKSLAIASVVIEARPASKKRRSGGVRRNRQ